MYKALNTERQRDRLAFETLTVHKEGARSVRGEFSPADESARARIGPGSGLSFNKPRPSAI